MTYLDTHIVVWLYRGDVELLSRNARDQIQNDDLLVSPVVVLELEYLKEIERLKASALQVMGVLSKEISLKVCDLPFSAVVEQALRLKWVRDPFDRLIVAQAEANEALLITKDSTIREHYRRCIW